MTPRTGPQRGVTLVVVLWTVAALTILVSGLVRAQRSELRLAGVARSQLQAVAAGQAAIAQVAQRLAPAPGAESRLTRWRERVGGQDIDVQVMPLTGLVDLNLAPEPLLAALLSGPGGVDSSAAQALAGAIQAERLAGTPRGQRRRFELVEELLAVPGVDPDLFARIAPFLTTDSAGTGRVNALAAPLPVLTVLARGDAEPARRIAADRDAGAAAIDTTRLEAAFVDATVSHRYRFTAFVPEPGGLSGHAVVRELDLRARRDGSAPWHVLRASVRRVPDLTAEHGGG